MLLGEKHLHPDDYETGLDLGDDQSWVCGDDLDLLRWTATLPKADGQGAPNEFGSAHGSGLNVARCDGSVAFLSFTVDLPIFQNFGNRDDGDPNSSF